MKRAYEFLGVKYQDLSVKLAGYVFIAFVVLTVTGCQSGSQWWGSQY